MYHFSVILRNSMWRISVVIVGCNFFPLKTFSELNIAIEKGDVLEVRFKLLTQSVFSCKPSKLSVNCMSQTILLETPTHRSYLIKISYLYT